MPVVSSAPGPSSVTSTVSWSGAYPSRTVAVAGRPACRVTLVSASCTIRYAASPTAAGSGRAVPVTSTVTGSPAAEVRSTSASSASSPGAGARGAPSSPCRSSSSTERSSPSDSRLA